MKIINKLLSVLITIFTLSLTGCEDMNEPHVHTFSNAWSADSTYHWHKSTCGHNVTSEKEEHKFGEWVAKTPATETTKGLKVQECTICGYKHEEIIPYTEHVHTFSEDWTSNANYHWHESTCGHDVTSTKEPHAFSSWIIDEEPTTEKEGKQHKTCTVCGYRVEEIIPRITEELPGLIKDKTLVDLFADESGNDKALYEVTGVVYSWLGSNTNGTQYGNFRVKTDINSETYYTIYGSTASLDALTYDETDELYEFTNPRDFLTNEITANIEIGDTLTMWLSRCDNGTYIEAHGVIISVSKAPIIPTEGTLTVDIYATNDIHGQIEDSGNRMDIATLGTFMKTKGQEDNTLLLDQGDSWQGSIYSNHNRGALVNDVMTAAHYDARTVGNHDFDWGIEPLKANTARAYNGYTIPVLAANVYDYNFSTKTEGSIQQSDIGRKTVSYVLENGLKVGIVGIIGDKQITSITSSYVQSICFKEHVSIIKAEAEKLRNDGCNIVILSAHTGQESLMDSGLEDYVDLALCGHTHSNETGSEGDLYYVQCGAYNERVGHIQLSYDIKTKKINKTSIETINKSQVNNQISSIDSEIASIVNTYSSECETEAKVVLANNTDSFAQSTTAANLMCKAILDRCSSEGFNDVVLSFSNTARKALPSGTWTYADIYNSFPFDNVVYIVNVKGSDLLNEVKKYNNCCLKDSFNCLVNPNSYYQIACLDYLLYHTNEDRIYDYFKSFNGTVVGELSINYRLILRQWLIDNGYNNGKYLASSSFSSYSTSFDRSRLTEI